MTVVRRRWEAENSLVEEQATLRARKQGGG